MKNVKEIANEMSGGLQEVFTTHGEQLNAFVNFAGTVLKPGALDTKTKELIGVGITVYARCESCVVEHVRKALEAGATREEIMEAAMVAVLFGGGPSLTYIATLVKPAIDEFAPGV